MKSALRKDKAEAKDKMGSVLLRLKVAVQRGSLFGPVWYCALTLGAVSALVVPVGSGAQRSKRQTCPMAVTKTSILCIIREAESLSG